MAAVRSACHAAGQRHGRECGCNVVRRSPQLYAAFAVVQRRLSNANRTASTSTTALDTPAAFVKASARIVAYAPPAANVVQNANQNVLPLC